MPEENIDTALVVMIKGSIRQNIAWTEGLEPLAVAIALEQLAQEIRQATPPGT